MQSGRNASLYATRGMTLIEVAIALAIAAMAAALAVIGLGAVTSAKLRSTAMELTGAIKFTYDRAIMEGRTQRLGLDIDKGLWWIDYTENPFALSASREVGKAGEKSDELETRDDPEKSDELEKNSFHDDREDPEVRAALEGGLAVKFLPDAEVGKPTPLSSGVHFTKVWTGHQEESFTSGVAYIHFFAGGFTEPSQIELSDDDEFVTLKVAPLTGRVRSIDRRLEDPEVEDPTREDEGNE